MNKNNLLTILGVIIIIIAAYFIYKAPKSVDDNQTAGYSSTVYTFSTAKDNFTIQYNDDSSKAKLSLDGTEYDLDRTISGSGAKYESADGSVVFWEHQGEATVTIDDETVVDSAALQETPTDTTDQTNVSDTDTTPSLLSNPWQWEQTKYSDNTLVTPNNADAFVMTFGEDGRFTSTTDCNNVAGEYEILDNHIVLNKMISTLMACPDTATQETAFTKMLSDSDSFEITNTGNLVLTLTDNSAEMIFTPDVKATLGN